MNTDSTAASYAQRAIRELGQQAHDSERVAIWCWDNPPRKPLPEVRGERNRQIWIGDMLKDALIMLAESMNGEYTSGTVDALANAVLTQFVKDNAPEIWALHERFQAERAEIKKRLKELRHNEPELQTQEERIAGVLKSDLAHYENP